MISYLDAIQSIKKEAAIRTLLSEEVSLDKSVGRVLASSVYGSEAIPAFDNSSMDGYAIRTRDLTPGVNQLPVWGRVIAGERPRLIREERIAVEIMTGAPLPEGGFDAVIKVEDVSKLNRGDTGDSIQFSLLPSSGQYIRKRGEDFQVGALLAAPGTLVDAKLLMGFAALGVRQVPVIKKPRVWVVSTGNEIVEHTEPELQLGEIRNATAPFLVSELERLGCEVKYLGIIKDETTGTSKAYQEALRRALDEQVDLFISTGAVSMGVHDFTQSCIVEMGGEIVFHRVNIRPGKPFLLAKFNAFPRTVVMGLPGNPVSTVVGTEFFVKPYLNAILSRAPQVSFKAQLDHEVVKPEGIRCFYKASWFTTDSGESRVKVLPGQASFMIHSLNEANAWVILPESGDRLLAGTPLEVIPFAERLS
jgi:molybdopterin molybdotransferase